MSDPANEHWIFTWLNEFEVDTTADIKPKVEQLFEFPAAVARLHELASEAIQTGNHSQIDDGSAVAGRTLDLSGPYTCNRFRCAKDRLDRTLRSTWHYFDSIVVTGPNERRLINTIENTPKRERQDLLVQPMVEQASLFGYIRSIGAEDLLIFRQKEYELCPCCTEKRAIESGFTVFEDKAAKSRLRDALKREADIRVYKGRSKGWHCEIDHELLPETFMFGMESASKPKNNDVLDTFFQYGAMALIQDLHQSRALSLPLIQELRTSFFGSETSAGANSPEAIAISLTLPFLDGLTSKDLIMRMREERESFYRFRAALRSAVREKAALADDKDPKQVSQHVISDIIEPELANIRHRVEIARKSLRKKTAASVAVGTALVTVGTLTAMPLVIGAGVTALASPMLDLKKYVEDSSSIELSDMYFLWQLGKSRA